MAFRVEESSLELVRCLRDLLPRIGRADEDLSRQIRRAASSVVLNLAEGNARAGKDRLHCFRIARGSAHEVRAGLRLATAWGYVQNTAVEQPLTIAKEVIAMLGALVR